MQIPCRKGRDLGLMTLLYFSSSLAATTSSSSEVKGYWCSTWTLGRWILKICSRADTLVARMVKQILHMYFTRPSSIIVTMARLTTISWKHQKQRWSAGILWVPQTPHCIRLTKVIPRVWTSKAVSSCSNPCTLVVHVCFFSTFRASAAHLMSSFACLVVLGNVSEGGRRGLTLCFSLGGKYDGAQLLLPPVRTGEGEAPGPKFGIGVARKLSILMGGWGVMGSGVVALGVVTPGTP